MAKAIRSIPAHADQTADAELGWEQIKQVAVENREGVQQAIRILGLLGDKGIRHNALDKLYGYALRQQLSLAGKVLTFSGRLSSEVVLKVAKLGVGIVLARSAPTALALDIADELNITAVGFVRNGSFNVYTHPRRIGKAL